MNKIAKNKFNESIKSKFKGLSPEKFQKQTFEIL
jgi:hypothetical protein